MARHTTYRDLVLHYDCDHAALPGVLNRRFVQLDLDAEGRQYVDRAIGRRAGKAMTALHRALLGYFSDFDVNGLLDMYPMHLLGTEQWRTLLGSAPERRHLDVGAGSGDITLALAPLSRETLTTEVSWAMAKKLRKRGFVCHRTDVATHGVPDTPYDLITCLNVIDRCQKPHTLLRQLRDALAPGGTLVIATPLPLNAFFYEGPATLPPAEALDVCAPTWEAAVTELVQRVLEPLGLRVQALTRTPYLSGGDSRRPLYILDDAIIVCRRAP